MNATKHQPWLWPDHIISKPESRRLREEHNALYNSNAELVESMQCILGTLHQPSAWPEGLTELQYLRSKRNEVVDMAQSAISKAKGNA